MSWATLLLALLKAGGALFDYLNTRRLISAGQAEAAVNLMRAQSDAASKALAVRQNVRDGLARDPGGLRADDGFQRKD